jgi:hypothetical protein
MTVTKAGLVTLHVGGETVYSEQLDPAKPEDAEWLARVPSPCLAAPLLELRPGYRCRTIRRCLPWLTVPLPVTQPRAYF